MDARALDEATILDTEGRPVRLADAWRSRPAIVVWLRHYGCMFCREQVAAFVAARPDIDALGATLVFVGNGTPRAAAWFRTRFAPGETLLTDPDLVTYQAIGARSGVLRTLGPRAWGAGIRAMRRGARQSSVRGHPFQQGAVLVVAPGGELVFSRVSRAAGDHPEVADVLAALRRAVNLRTKQPA